MFDLSPHSRVVCVLVMQAEGRKFDPTQGRTVSVLRDEKGPSQPFIL
jgi:hypothetical protein